MILLHFSLMEYGNVGSKFKSSLNEMIYKLFRDDLEALFTFQVLKKYPLLHINKLPNGWKQAIQGEYWGKQHFLLGVWTFQLKVLS